MQPNACGVPNLTSNFDTVSLISSIVPGRCKYFGLKISFVALQTLDAVFETVLCVLQMYWLSSIEGQGPLNSTA